MERVWIWAVGADLVPTHGPEMNAELKGRVWNRRHSGKGEGATGGGVVSGPRTHSVTACACPQPPVLCPASRVTATLLGNQYGGLWNPKAQEAGRGPGCTAVLEESCLHPSKGYPGVPSVASCKASCVLMKCLAGLTGLFPPSRQGGPGSKE